MYHYFSKIIILHKYFRDHFRSKNRSKKFQKIISRKKAGGPAFLLSGVLKGFHERILHFSQEK